MAVPPTSDLLQQQGIARVQTQAYKIEYRAGTRQGDLFFQDIRHLYRTSLPFLHKRQNRVSVLEEKMDENGCKAIH